MVTPGNYSKNVFINCPFDDDYKPLLKCLLFTVIYIGLEPKIASYKTDSAEVRFSKIKNLIKKCKYSIHDISRMKPTGNDELPRFNMPFELGLDFGCREYGNQANKDKIFLVMDREPYRYKKVISDLSGHDFRSHNSDPETLIRKVRNWFRETLNKSVPSGNTIWQDYNEFYDDFLTATKKEGYDEKDLGDMPIIEFIDYMNNWKWSKINK